MLKALKRKDRERLKIPKSVQQSLPIKCIYKDGLWLTGNNFSKTWRFSDVNYALASEEDQEALLKLYGNILNSLPTDAAAKITINNHALNKEQFRQNLLMAYRNDGLDQYRAEYNRLLQEKAAQSNNIIQEKYITVFTPKPNRDEAKAFFNRVDTDLRGCFNKLGAALYPLDNTERLRLFHDFFRAGEEHYFDLDLQDVIRKGHDIRDHICPESMIFKNHYFMMDDKYGRVLYLKSYASHFPDTLLSELAAFPRNQMITVDILPVATDKAVKELQNHIMAVETDITRWQQKQNMNNNFTATTPYDYELMREAHKGYLDDLTTRDQRMIFCLVTIVHLADSLQALDADTETLLSMGRQGFCQLGILRYQQEDGLNTVLPYGVRRIEATRSMVTEEVTALMPFHSQEILEPGGIYFGQNAVSHNLIICDRKQLLNGNGFILGSSGSGKSFAAKEMIAFVALSTEDDIIIADPENEVRHEVA